MLPDPDPTLIAGRYRKGERLGRGGMGEIYEARDVRLDVPCAIKLIRPSVDPRIRAEKRLVREARLTARVLHENVVRILDFGQDADHGFYLVMEFIQGRPLQRVLRQEGGHLGARRAVSVVCQLLSALDAVHNAGIVHRDIKPSNLMLLDAPVTFHQDAVKLLDFGISRTNEDENLTEGVFIGSQSFAAPEQLRGDPDIDARADLYSAATLLHYLLTGQYPYPRHKDQPREVYEVQKLTLPPRIIDQLPDGRPLPPALKAVIARGLEREPRKRYASALDMLDDLRPYLREEEELTLPEPLRPHLFSRLLPPAVVVGGLLALALAVRLWWLLDQVGVLMEP